MFLSTLSTVPQPSFYERDVDKDDLKDVAYYVAFWCCGGMVVRGENGGADTNTTFRCTGLCSSTTSEQKTKGKGVLL